MGPKKERSFGAAIRTQRRRLDLTQEEVAKQIGTSVPYVGHLESAKRHPSDRIVIKLAAVLGLDPRDLYFLANPEARDLIEPKTKSGGGVAWERFKRDERLGKMHGITPAEMEVLGRVAQIGEVKSIDGLLHLLHTIRYVLSR
ncbi:MAG: helix-turn-helix transcriptional regulator [Candidatus Binataceae bacterium]|nr:helix-turn-helix transcriptional regulator [Candidatus Binataceae bacterium]